MPLFRPQQLAQLSALFLDIFHHREQRAHGEEHLENSVLSLWAFFIFSLKFVISTKAGFEFCAGRLQGHPLSLMVAALSGLWK